MFYAQYAYVAHINVRLKSFFYWIFIYLAYIYYLI